MATIRQRVSRQVRPLEAEHLVGRAQTCSLHIPLRFVSGQHAIIRYDSDRWRIRDLGSLNGTYVDSVRLKPGEEHVLHIGSAIAFGKLEQEWELIDDEPPRAMAVPFDEACAPILAENDFLAVPSNEDPRATIFKTVDGTWILEQSESAAPITNQQFFEIANRSYRFSCPEVVCKTSLADALRDIETRHLTLVFSVSRDEEHVELSVSCGSRVFNLGARNRNYFLLTLARQRLSDSKDGSSDASCGWVYQEDLARDLKVDSSQLNIDVFRVRQQFASIGVIDAANIVERRPRTRQLRLGPNRLSVVRL